MSDNNLHNSPGENKYGFDVPENYFEGNKQRLLQRANNGGFVVPEHYFNQSRNEIMNAVARQPGKGRIVAIGKWWYAAAAILLVTAGLWLIPANDTPKAALDSVTNEEIVNYFLASENISDIPVNELYSTEIETTAKEDEEMIYQLDEELLLNEL